MFPRNRRLYSCQYEWCNVVLPLCPHLTGVCADEPIRPIDPAAWVSHSVALTGAYPTYPGSSSLSTITSSSSVTETERKGCTHTWSQTHINTHGHTHRCTHVHTIARDRTHAHNHINTQDHTHITVVRTERKNANTHIHVLASTHTITCTQTNSHTMAPLCQSRLYSSFSSAQSPNKSSHLLSHPKFGPVFLSHVLSFIHRRISPSHCACVVRQVVWPWHHNHFSHPSLSPLLLSLFSVMDVFSRSLAIVARPLRNYVFSYLCPPALNHNGHGRPFGLKSVRDIRAQMKKHVFKRSLTYAILGSIVGCM